MAALIDSITVYECMSGCVCVCVCVGVGGCECVGVIVWVLMGVSGWV